MVFIICIIAVYLIFVGLVLLSISKNNEIKFTEDFKPEEETEGAENGDK